MEKPFLRPIFREVYSQSTSLIVQDKSKDKSITNIVISSQDLGVVLSEIF